MTNREQLILKYLTSSQNRFNLIIRHLTLNFEDSQQNPTTQKEQGEVLSVYKIIVKDLNYQLETIYKLLD